jgi:eukaryotic-like serine/threonine-protein kinase
VNYAGKGKFTAKMDSDRWQKVKELYEAALKYPAGERTRFLYEKCGCDEDLRREVKSLLAYSDEAESFLEAPAVGEVAEVIVKSENAELPVGNSFSHYKIIKKIGAGGMGEVYLAKDTLLDRNVALKILLPEIAKDEDRVRRFKLEASAASALNHPNIVTIYEIGEAGDKLFIAYEFVDGNTLREKIARNQLTIFDAVKIAEQIANALAVTHEAGVVHRDVKPENIMIRHDGYVKILDFGLAKRRIFKSDSEDETIEQIKTQRGVILGSVQYMSPEQARGTETDARTDIWSLGVVFYEMLAGKNPFEGATISDSIAAILHFEPEPLHKVISNIPAELEKIINKALRKDLFERYQSGRDFLSDLTTIDLQNQPLWFNEKTLELPRTVGVESKDKTDSQEIAQETQFAGKITDEQNKTKTQDNAEPNLKERPLKSLNYRIWIIMSVPFLLTIFGLFRSEIISFFFAPKPKAPFESIQITQLTEDGSATPDCALSPDGKFVAFVKRIENDKESLIVRQILTGSTVEIIPPSPVRINSLTFSPNGEFIYYFISKRVDELARQMKVIYKIPEMHFLYKVPTLGGRSEELFKDQFVNSKITFSPDGGEMVFVKDFGAETSVFIADSEGSAQREVLKNTEIAIDRIDGAGWLPDGKGLILAVSKGENIAKNKPVVKTRIAAFDLNERTLKTLSEQAWAVAHSFRLLGDNSGVVFLGNQEKKDILQIWYLLLTNAQLRQITTDSSGFTSFDTSKDGKTILAAKGEGISSLWSFDPLSKGFKQLKSESRIPFANAPISLMPDGRILFSKVVGTKVKIFSMSEDGNNEKQITFNDGDDFYPVLTPDGKYIFFSSNRSGRICLWRINSDGTNPLQITRVEYGVDERNQIMPDGKSILFSRVGGEDQGVRKISIDGGESELLIPTRDSSYYRNPKISPNGKYLAFLNNEYDRATFQPKYLLKVANFNNERMGSVITEKELDSFNDTFQWSPDSSSLTYIKDGTPNLWSFPIKGGKETRLTDFSLGNLRNYAWSADGKRILIIRGIVNFDLVLIKDTNK